MRRSALAAALLLAACTPSVPQPPPTSRYVLGEPVRLGGQWVYPREDFGLDQQGIAAILPARSGRTANGEALDPRAMIAAHRTLQLPAIVTVTNLENGRAVRLRLNERGPDAAGRLLAVSPRAAELLGARGPFQARITVDAAASRAAILGLGGQAAPLAIAAAPVGRVERESLAPPAGARAAAARAEAPSRAAAQPDAPAAPAPERLPEQVQQFSPQPGNLHIEGPSFFRRDFAQAQAARLGFRTEPLGPPGRQQQWRVIGGPFANLAEADAAFARALASGQQDLRLVVE
jgi:rare lipoprotein A